MPYNAEISRSSPSCFVFLIDQSGSIKNPIVFPAGPRELPDDFARDLFGESSRLPENLVQQARVEEVELESKSPCLVFNADPAERIRFLLLRTRSSHLNQR